MCGFSAVHPVKQWRATGNCDTISGMEKSRTVAILANGAPPQAVQQKMLFAADKLICCDGAYRVAKVLNRVPDHVVGDGDSLSGADREELGARFVLRPDQDTNDLDKAFRFACETYPDHAVVILGASGFREDHFLGNVFRLFDFARRTSRPVSLCTDHGVFEVVASERSFACAPGDAVSVFAVDPATHVTSSGLVWPLDGVAFENHFCGTLNRTSGDGFTLNPDRPILVFRAWH